MTNYHIPNVFLLDNKQQNDKHLISPLNRYLLSNAN